MSRTIDYGELIAEAVADRSGNGLRADAAARIAHAFMFYEVAKACEAAHKRGFPLWVSNAGETFLVGAGATTGLGPCFHFKRAGSEVSVFGSNVPTYATGEHDSRSWTPGELPAAEVQLRSIEAVTWVVQSLARTTKR